MFVSKNDVLNFVKENDVKFIRLSFCDLKGNLKNMAIMSGELPFVIENGMRFDGGVLEKNSHEKLLLFPDLSTMSILPWRPKSGSVVRFFCNIKHSDGSPYLLDMRTYLQEFVNDVKTKGYDCNIGTKCEFYLFKNDDNGNPTKEPIDFGGYLDVSPLDHCEDIRREICLSLEEMGISPQSSCHKRGPGQNEIDFLSSDPVTAADNSCQYKNVVKSLSMQNGYYASFMPKPIPDWHGSAFSIGFHINKDGNSIFASAPEGESFAAGILKKLKEITVFLNPITNSYRRLGQLTAPKYIDLSEEINSHALLLSNTLGNGSILSIMTADAACNPYITFLLLLKAGFEGIENNTKLADIDMTETLPTSLQEAVTIAKSSEFVKKALPDGILKQEFEHFDILISEYNNAKNKEDYEEKKFFYTI